jgi:hypothetical protein
MPYSLPTFNLLAKAKANFNFALGANPVAPFILPNLPCNLQYARRRHDAGGVVGLTAMIDNMYLLFPMGSALKGRSSYALKWGDAVEVPQGSGRWYSVVSVDSVARGFANEFLCAVLVQPACLTALAPLWP